MTTANAANTIRSQLKAAGISTRDVSVRVIGSGSTYGSIKVLIKAADVDGAKVTAIAKAGEKIDRCARTGDLLGGGLVFVTVDVADDVAEAEVSNVRGEAPVQHWRDCEIWLVNGAYQVHRGRERSNRTGWTLANAIKVAILAGWGGQ